MVDDTLHSLGVRIQELEKQVQLHVRYQEQAVSVAARELEQRLRKDEVLPKIRDLEDDLNNLQKSYAGLQERLWAFGVIGVLILSAVGYWLR